MPDVVLEIADRIGRGDSTHWTARELLAHCFPPPRWAVPGLIPEGVTLLAGQPKTGKSWLALNVAVAVASGGVALGKTRVESGPVLYLALEDTARRLASRLRKVLDTGAAPDALAFDTAWPALGDGGAEQLDRWLRTSPGARLVIVDVLARVRGRTSSNVAQYDLDYSTMAELKTLADRHQVPVVVVHHTRKASDDDFLNEVSGTNGLAGAADAIIVLKRSRGTADAELHVTGRDIDELTYALNFDPATGSWTMLDGPATDYVLGGTRQEIIRYLREEETGSPKQIADALSLKYETIKKTCLRMSDDGQLHTDGQGHYFLPWSAVPPVPSVPEPHWAGLQGHEGHLAAAAEVADL